MCVITFLLSTHRTLTSRLQDEGEEIELGPARRGRPLKKKVTQEEADALSPRKTRKRGTSAKEAELDDEEEEEEQASPVKKPRRHEREESKGKGKPKVDPKPIAKVKAIPKQANTKVGTSSKSRASSSRASSLDQDDEEKGTRGKYAEEVYALTSFLVEHRKLKKPYDAVRISDVVDIDRWLT